MYKIFVQIFSIKREINYIQDMPENSVTFKNFLLKIRAISNFF